MHLAFQSDKGDTEANIICCIESLETGIFFDFVHEITPGIMAGFLLKGKASLADMAHNIDSGTDTDDDDPPHTCGRF